VQCILPIVRSHCGKLRIALRTLPFHPTFNILLHLERLVCWSSSIRVLTLHLVVAGGELTHDSGRHRWPLRRRIRTCRRIAFVHSSSSEGFHELDEAGRGLRTRIVSLVVIDRLSPLDCPLCPII